MQDYAYPPPRAFPPLIGEGAWPDGYVDTLGLLLLILVVGLCYASHRAGRRIERRRFDYDTSRGPEIIFHAIRRQIDVALLATGERAFGPVRTLIETLEAYLGPVLRLAEGPAALTVSVHKLKKALATEKKKIVVEPEKHGHGHGPGHTIGHGAPGGSTVIITTTPQPGEPHRVASAAASVGPGGGVQVVQPARVIEIPAHDPHAHAHAEVKVIEKEVELTARERALAVREALECLSDYWQKERVESELRAAQKALTITRPIGDKPVLIPRPRPAGPPPVANPVAKAAREANRGFSLFRF